MPYKSENIRIAGTEFDQRIKITDVQKKAIKILYRHAFSQRTLAKLFNVSKTSVGNIVNPSKKKRSNSFHSKEYWNEMKKKCRNRKQELFKKGLIK